MITLKPLRDMVHLERLENEKKAGAIFIPETAQDRRLRAKVLSVGPGKFDHGVFVPTTLKPGDIVLIPYMRGADLSESKEKQELVLPESDIHGVITGG